MRQPHSGLKVMFTFLTSFKVFTEKSPEVLTDDHFCSFPCCDTNKLSLFKTIHPLKKKKLHIKAKKKIKQQQTIKNALLTTDFVMVACRM